jgi:hypothetical protein
LPLEHGLQLAEILIRQVEEAALTIGAQFFDVLVVLGKFGHQRIDLLRNQAMGGADARGQAVGVVQGQGHGRSGGSSNLRSATIRTTPG